MAPGFRVPKSTKSSMSTWTTRASRKYEPAGCFFSSLDKNTYFVSIKGEGLLDKPVIILDDDLSETNEFQFTVVYPEINETQQPAIVSSLLKLEHHITGINHTRTGVRGSLLSLRKNSVTFFPILLIHDLLFN